MGHMEMHDAAFMMTENPKRLEVAKQLLDAVGQPVCTKEHAEKCSVLSTHRNLRADGLVSNDVRANASTPAAASFHQGHTAQISWHHAQDVCFRVPRLGLLRGS